MTHTAACVSRLAPREGQTSHVTLCCPSREKRSPLQPQSPEFTAIRCGLLGRLKQRGKERESVTLGDLAWPCQRRSKCCVQVGMEAEEVTSGESGRDGAIPAHTQGMAAVVLRHAKRPAAGDRRSAGGSRPTQCRGITGHEGWGLGQGAEPAAVVSPMDTHTRPGSAPTRATAWIIPLCSMAVHAVLSLPAILPHMQKPLPRPALPEHSLAGNLGPIMR